YGDSTHCFVWNVVHLLVPSREPSIPLHRHRSAVGQVVFTDRRAQRAGSATSTSFSTAQVAHAHGGVTVPPEGDQDILCHSTRDRHGCTLQRCYWTSSAHVDSDGIPQILNSQVGGEVLGRRGQRRRDNAVNVVRGEPGVSDGLH